MPDQVLETDDQVAAWIALQVASGQLCRIEPAGRRAAGPPLAVGPQFERGVVAVTRVAQHVDHARVGELGEDHVGIALDQPGLVAPSGAGLVLGVVLVDESEQAAVGGRPGDKFAPDTRRVGFQKAHMLIMHQGRQTAIQIIGATQIAVLPVEIAPHVGADGRDGKMRMRHEAGTQRRLAATIRPADKDGIGADGHRFS